ncbi:MAG: SpoIIE family protein phosphatase [Lachnospiraceae bacterium]|nr:SpoIIE family protein phosphatase [Lachnospiraceae bacterium]
MENWQELKIIKDFYQIEEDGSMPEGSRILLDATDLATFEPGEDIVTYGASADDGMYIILEGRTKVLGPKGALISEQESGDVVGELALIKDGTRKATVRAATKVTCAHLSKPVFEGLAQSNTKVYGAFLELLYTKTTKIVVERERMKSELEIAAKIQSGYLPKSFGKFNKMPDVHIAARMKPAKEVGGDFYDVFQIDEDRLCFLIADVSGKGVPASLFMTVAKTHIKNYMSLDMPLAEMAERVNNQLNEDNDEELFVTVFICVLDVKNHTLSFVNGGHNKPCISRAGGAFEMMDCKVDFVFGMMEDMPYREQKTTLMPGDKFYLYTDGVTEAFNDKEELFGDDRLVETLNRHMDIAGEPDRLLDTMYEELHTFANGADQSDDITMVYLVR